jgi:integrase
MTGITIRRRAGGRSRYVARVRRGGINTTAMFDTVEEAAAWRAQTLAALRTGDDLPPPPKPADAPAVALPAASVTVEDACRELIVGMRSGAIRDNRGRTYKPATVFSYERRLRHHVLPLIGAVPVVALRRGDVRRMVDELVVRQTPSVARGAFGALRVVLRRQVDLEVIPANVCAGVRVPTVDASPKRFLTPEEAEALQAAADADRTPQIGPFVALAIATGMRRGELEALVWGPDGLDLAVGQVRIAVTLDPSGAIVSTKNRDTRAVPIGPETTAVMRRWLLASGRPPDGARVFPAPNTTTWQRVRAAAGLADPQPRIHDLRHTAATFWLAAGLKSHAVAQLLGHTDAGLVDRLYGHALPDEVSSAGIAMEAWLASRFGSRFGSRAPHPR